ncbi:MAG: prephenate dehydratase [Elusimicrobiota bacterium]
MKVAYQGVRGAYSEAALVSHFGPEVEPVGFAFSEQVFDAVESGEAGLGFVPVENSIAGSVGANTDLLLERKVFAVAESYLPIEHCLLGRPGSRLEDVKSVRSHPIALAQCRNFLNARGLLAVPEYDTAGSAEMVAARGTPGEAAIASRRCASVYGLVVLAENIASAAVNITRFLAFARPQDVPAGLAREKTSLAFSVHHRPGALLECLKLFADHAINLTKLESRPIASNPFEYSFFVDFLGGTEDVAAKAALAELALSARHVKILGSYPLAARPAGK